MNMVVLDASGRVTSFTTTTGHHHVSMRDGDAEPVAGASILVEWPGVDVRRGTEAPPRDAR
jgi:hypothetical protein